MDRRIVWLRAFVAMSPFIAACGSSIHNAGPVVSPPSKNEPAGPTREQTAPVPAPDPVLVLIERSQQHFESGERHLELGHVVAARQEFDRALGVLLESSYGGRSEPRIREHFDRLVDRISGYEVKALAEGDGFTEKQYEPASIDELLALSSTFGNPLPTEDLKAIVQTDLDRIAHDIPIPLNERVLSYVELFQGRLHDFIAEGLIRGSKYLPMIQNVFRAQGLPLDLAYVPLIESAFKPNALSRASAKGVWQFMRGTGLENGLRQDWFVDERSDPEKSTVAAAKYLGTLHDSFDGDWHLALASYNGGPGRVQKAIKLGRQSDFWLLSKKTRLLPRETREYVPMILAAIVIARNPAHYGFDFEPDPPHEYETVTLARPVDLRLIAEWANTTIDEIQQLNPELRRWMTPVGDSAYAVKVPRGTAGLVNARLMETPLDENLATVNWHTVRKGETLSVIARKLKVNRTDLASANSLKITSRVAAGQKLMVPQKTMPLLAARTERSTPLAESRPITQDQVVPAVLSASSGVVESERVKMIYEVKRGDTLSSIARLFRTTVASLRTWNQILGTRIRVGERLTIYRAAGSD